MHFLTASLGAALLILTGLAAVLALILLVVWLASRVVRVASRIGMLDEQPPLQAPRPPSFSWETEPPAGPASLSER
jgi:hypothetical protein